jgi:ABC-2 type transport system ATP-binding protein
VVIDHGSVIAEGTSEELKANLGETVIELVFKDDAGVETAVQALASIGSLTRDGRFVRVSVSDGATAMIETVRSLDTAQVSPATLALREPTLDDVFLALTGHAAEEPTDGDEPEPSRRRPKRGGR